MKKGKTERQKIVDKLDDAVSLYIRLLEKKSVTSGRTDKLTNSHLFSRNSYSTRWDITEDGNCHCQTSDENFRHEFDPHDYTAWYINKFGIDKYDELHRRHKTILKLKDFQLQEMLEDINSKIKLLKLDTFSNFVMLYILISFLVSNLSSGPNASNTDNFCEYKSSPITTISKVSNPRSINSWVLNLTCLISNPVP